MNNFGIRLPFGAGRLLYERNAHGKAIISGAEVFSSELVLEHFHKREKVDERRLGSGLVTNAGVAMLANDWNWAANAQTFKLQNFHATGTGTTAAAATDIALQTSAGPSPATGTQSNPSVAGTAQYKTVGTLTYSSSLAITEWGLFGNGTLSASSGSPATATSATTLTCTGTPLTVNAWAGYIIVAGTVWGLIASNTSSVFTLVSGWVTTSSGAAGSTPSSSQAYTLQPVMWDHKVFSAINVVNTDSIQVSYVATLASGG